VVGAAADGRWHLPQQDDAHLLAWMPLQREAGDFRVLWVGDPGVLPLDGWRLSDGLAYAVSRGGTPDVSALWPGPSSGPTHLLADALAVARRGQTTRLGHLLAPMAVRYIALPVRLAPGTQRDPASPLPGDLDAALRSQLDLKEVESDPAVRVYENVSWAPARSLVPPAAAGALTARRADASTDVELAGSTPVLEGSDGPNSFSGSVSGPRSLYLSEAASPRWQLHAGGHRQLRQTAFGWANVFEVDGGGAASLAYATPLSRYAAVAIELALWALAIREIIRRRRRRRLVDVTVAAAGDVVEAQSIDAMEAAVVGAAGLAASRGGR
jgi:hypothetical protein